MNYLSNFFRKHPLLALFLVSALTIICINWAISLQSSRFAPEQNDKTDTWIFGEAEDPPKQLASFAKEQKGRDDNPTSFDRFPATSGPSDTRITQATPADNIAENSLPDEPPFFFFENTEPDTVADFATDGHLTAVDNVTPTETVAPLETIKTTEADAPMTLTLDTSDEPTSAKSEDINFFADEPISTATVEDTAFPVGTATDQVAANEPHGNAGEPENEPKNAKSEDVDLFIADLGSDEESMPEEEDSPVSADSVAVDSSSAEDAISKSTPETTVADSEIAEPTGAEPVDFFDDVAVAAPEESTATDLKWVPVNPVAETAEPADAEPVDFFDNIAVAAPEESTVVDLNWVPANPASETVKATVPDSTDLSDSLSWDILATDEQVTKSTPVYEAQEPDAMVAERFDADAAKDTEVQPQVTEEVAATEEQTTEVSATEAESTAQQVAEQVEPATETEASATEAESTAQQVAEQVEPATEAEASTTEAESTTQQVAEQVEPATEAEASATEAENTVQQVAERASAPAGAEQGAEVAEAPQSETKEPVVTADNETAKPASSAAPAPAKVARVSEVWAISSERLSGVTVDPTKLACWRADSGKFVPSTIEEYKSTLHPDIPTVILIHGNMTEWSGALKHAQSLKYRIDKMRSRQRIQTPYRLVIWKWASQRQDQRIRSDSQVKAYLADLNGFYLASFLSATNGTGSDVTMLGFSFGARTIGCALELLVGGTCLGHSLPAAKHYVASDRYHAILLAGACNYGDFSTRGLYARGSQLLSSMVNVFNPSDNALHFYPLLYGAGGPQAIGVAPVDPSTAPASFKNRLWSINSSAYGPQHNFDNLLYAICDPLLGNMIYAGKIWSTADAIPAVSNAEIDPEIRRFGGDEEPAPTEDDKVITENQ
jgi:hypothetical protein